MSDTLLGAAAQGDTDAAAPAAVTPETESKSPETTPDESKPGDQSAPAAESEAPPSYEFTVPEGFELDATLLDPAKAFFSEAKLSPEAAQKLVDIYSEHQMRRAEEQTKAFQGQIKSWQDAVNADKELSSSENKTIAARAARHFGSPELLKVLNETGLGDHPEVVRAFLKIGKAFSEDRLEREGGAAKPRSREEAWKDFYANPVTSTPSDE